MRFLRYSIPAAIIAIGLVVTANAQFFDVPHADGGGAGGAGAHPSDTDLCLETNKELQLGGACGTGNASIFNDGVDTIFDGRKSGTGDMLFDLSGTPITPDASTFHFRFGDAGSVACTGFGLCVEHSSFVNLSLIAPDNRSKFIYFGETFVPTRAHIKYFSSAETPADTFEFATASVARLRISAGAFAFQEATTISAPATLTLKTDAGDVKFETAGDIDANGNTIFDATGPLNLGTAASTGHGLGTGDVIFGDKTEFDGVAWFDSQSNFASTIKINDLVNVFFGTGSDTLVLHNANNTPDTMFIGLSPDSMHLVIADRLDVNFDFAHAQETNPTVFIQSVNQSTTEWTGVTHNQIDGVLSTGTGNLVLDPFANVVVGASFDDVQPTFSIIGDADSDGAGDTSETFTITLTPNADPTLATWGFTSTQSAGYTFDKSVTVAGDLTVAGTTSINTLHGEMLVTSGAGLTIALQSTVHTVDTLSTGSVVGFTFAADNTGPCSNMTTASGGAAVNCADVAHGLATGDVVVFSDVTPETTYNGVRVITKVDDDNFTIPVTFTNDDTGNWRQGDRIVADAGSSGQYGVHFSATLVKGGGAGQEFTIQGYINETASTRMLVDIELASTDASSVSFTGIITIADGDEIFMTVTNNDGTNDITLRHVTFWITRI